MVVEKSIARVVPELHLDKSFDYCVPDGMRKKLAVGAKVRVPFGKRILGGYIIDWVESSPYGSKESLKTILSVADPIYHLPLGLIELARWVVDYYCAPWGMVLRCLLPQAVSSELGALSRLRVELVQSWVEERDGTKFNRAPRQREALRQLSRLNGSAWVHELTSRWGIARETLNILERKGWVRIFSGTKERIPDSGFCFRQNEVVDLNAEQSEALRIIFDKDRDKPFLLFGVTGSGKTEIYLQTISRILDEGMNALVLVPEIGLIPQMVARFYQRFDLQRVPIAVLHSQLSAGERHDAWHRIRRGDARVVIGARSAIFAPLEKIGVIIVDEEHEQSYKNEECPYYHARDLAVWRARAEGARVILGSATPSVESWYNVKVGKYVMVQLTKRVAGQSMPLIHVLDQRKAKGALIHPELKSAVDEALGRGDQILLLLNRRGYAPVQECEDCGAVTMCPHCSVPLNFHRATGKLHCHLCHYEEALEVSCKSCGSHRTRLSGAGTERLEEAIESCFAKARIVRMDSDSTRRKGSHASILRAMEYGKVDILVGTQMIAKGLHFPRVSCVGVINADQALRMPDFRASERVFQLITQVAGRCGRGSEEGHVFLQTNSPYHGAIQQARHHDYLGFVEDEIEFRKALRYPPIGRTVLITLKGSNESKTRWVSEKILKALKERVASLAEVPEAPSPAPIYKIKGCYRYQIFLKTFRILPLSRALRQMLLEAKWPSGIQCSIDVDPYDLL